MSNNKLVTLSFEDIFNLYNYLVVLNDKVDNILKMLFVNLNKNTSNSFFYTTADLNFLIDQEGKEANFIECEEKDKILRFFQPYYDSINKQVKNETLSDLPDFLKTKLDFGIHIPGKNINQDPIEYKNAKEEYNNLSDDEKIRLQAQIMKTYAIIFARQANALNRFKNNTSDYSILMEEKDEAMKNFLIYAIKYNNLVDDNHQILFGINSSKKGPVLNASIPGYTRLSLHFGNKMSGNAKCIGILNQVNNSLKEEYFKFGFSGNEYDINKLINNYINSKKDALKDRFRSIIKDIYQYYPYPLDTFGVINTGLINCMDCADSEKYIGKITRCLAEKEELDENERDNQRKKRIELFCNFIYPDLNDREIFFLAERAEFGKGYLLELQLLLEDRAKRLDDKKDNKSIRKNYINDLLKNCKTDEEKLEKIIEVYDTYSIIMDDKAKLEDFKKLLEDCNISEDLFNKFKIQKKYFSFEDIFTDLYKYDISVDLFTEKFLEADSMEILFSRNLESDSPQDSKEEKFATIFDNFNESYFRTIFQNVNISSKMLLIIKTFNEMMLNKPVLKSDDDRKKYEEQVGSFQKRLEGIILDEMEKKEELKEYNTIFVEFAQDAFELISKIDNLENESEISKLVYELLGNYALVVWDYNQEYKEEDMEIINQTLDNCFVSEKVIKPLHSKIYDQMLDAAKESDIEERSKIDDMEEKMLDDNSKKMVDEK